MLLPRSAGPGPRYRMSSFTQYNKYLSPRLYRNPLLAVHPPKPLPTRADDDLLLVARDAVQSVKCTNSSVLSTSVAGGSGLKRVTILRTIGAVGVSAPALTVEVANLGILADKNITN